MQPIVTRLTNSGKSKQIDLQRQRRNNKKAKLEEQIVSYSTALVTVEYETDWTVLGNFTKLCPKPKKCKPPV